MWIDLTIRCIDQLKKIMLIILLTTRYSPCLRKCDLHLTSKNYLKKKTEIFLQSNKIMFNSNKNNAVIKIYSRPGYFIPG